jgi:hypothetical protein
MCWEETWLGEGVDMRCYDNCRLGSLGRLEAVVDDDSRHY